MKKYILLLTLTISFICYSELKITIKPIIFKDIRAENNGVYRNLEKARGIITIESDNLQEDKGKLVEFKTPQYITLTNKVNSINSHKIVFKDKILKYIISEENTKIIFHILLDKKQLNCQIDSEKIEGIYEGILNINYSIYSKEMW